MIKLNRKGITLVEVVISLLIILIGASGIFASFIAAQNYVMRAKRRIAAVNVARQKFEELKPFVRQDTWAQSTNELYAGVGSTQPYICGTVWFNSTWNGTLNYTVTNPDVASFRNVSMTLNWTEPE